MSRPRKWLKKGSVVNGFVYVVQCGEFTKIGIATWVKTRVMSLQTGNPEPIQLLKSWRSRNAGAEELKLHKHLRKYRVRGEWFKLPSHLLDGLLGI